MADFQLLGFHYQSECVCKTSAGRSETQVTTTLSLCLMLSWSLPFVPLRLTSHTLARFNVPRSLFVDYLPAHAYLPIPPATTFDFLAYCTGTEGRFYEHLAPLSGRRGIVLYQPLSTAKPSRNFVDRLLLRSHS